MAITKNSWVVFTVLCFGTIVLLWGCGGTIQLPDVNTGTVNSPPKANAGTSVMAALT